MQIVCDGVTVWVNNSDGYCIARFGRLGIDIHRKSDESEAKGECLHCTHGPTTKDHWEEFKRELLKHYGVKLPARVIPERFKQKKKKHVL